MSQRRIAALILNLFAFAAVFADSKPVADPAEIDQLVKEIEPPPLPAPLLHGGAAQAPVARQAYDAATMKPYLLNALAAEEILKASDKHPLAAAALQAG